MHFLVHYLIVGAIDVTLNYARRVLIRRIGAAILGDAHRDDIFIEVMDLSLWRDSKGMRLISMQFAHLFMWPIMIISDITALISTVLCSRAFRTDKRAAQQFCFLLLSVKGRSIPDHLRRSLDEQERTALESGDNTDAALP